MKNQIQTIGFVVVVVVAILALGYFAASTGLMGATLQGAVGAGPQ